MELLEYRQIKIYYRINHMTNFVIVTVWLQAF